MMTVTAGCTLYFLVDPQQLPFLRIPTHGRAECPHGSLSNNTQANWIPEKNAVITDV